MKPQKQITQRITEIENLIRKFSNIGDQRQVENLENIKVALMWVLE